MIATTYQPLGSHRQAVDKPTFDSDYSNPYRQETEYLFRNAHQTPVSNRQVNEEHRPNIHNSCCYPITICQRPSVSFRQGTDNPQTVPSTFNLAELHAFNKLDPLPEWKLGCLDGNPLDWFERFGQFKSAIDSSHLSNDVKLTYLKTLVSGKAKAAIEHFAYCGTLYEEALRTLQRKFGQPQAVVSAYLEKLSNPPWIRSRFEQHQSFKSNCSKTSTHPQRSMVVFNCQTVSRATVTRRIQHMAPAKGRSA